MSARAVAGSLAMLAILVMSGTALADDAGIYISAAGGIAQSPENVALGVPGVALLSGTADGSDPSFGFGIGYRFNRNVSLDLGYVDLGAVEADIADLSGRSDARGSFTFAADGVALSLLGSFPIGNWEPYVKAGVLFSETQLSYSGSMSGTPFSGRVTNKEEDALYGVGVRYALLERFKIYLDATYLMDVGGEGGGQADFLNTSLGVIWQF
jgi:hypothetical protein